MPLAFFGDTDRQASVVLKVNLGHVFIALGALLTPALTDVFFRTLRYRRTLLVLAAFCLIPALLCIPPALAGSLPRAADQGADRIAEHLSRDLPWLLMAGLVFFCYAPLEGAVSVWTTTYLTEMGDGERKATWILTAFWTAFLTSRLLVAWLLYAKHGNQFWPWILVFSAILATVSLGNLAGTASRSRARLGLLLIGFFLGPIFPTLVGLLLKPVGEHFRGTTYGLFFAFGSLGSLLLAPFIVRRGDRDTTLRGLVPLLLALAMTILAIGFVVVVPS